MRDLSRPHDIAGDGNGDHVDSVAGEAGAGGGIGRSKPSDGSGGGRDKANGDADGRAETDNDGWLPTPADGGWAGATTVDDGTPRHRRKRKEKEPRSPLRTVLEWVGVIGGGIVIALIIEAFLVQAFWIPSPSMAPTLEVGDRVLVNKLSYRLHDVHRGDVIVFERPTEPEGPDDDIKDLIKRVIAVGGDTIEARNGLVYVNGERVDESDYLVDGTPTDDLPRTTVPEGHVFVMGDNRTNSQDSRRFGPIDEDTIVGRAFIRVLPLNDIGWL